MPGYPQPLPRPAQPDCFRIEEIPGKGKGLVATKDMKWGDLIFAERPMIINPTGLPVNCNKLDIPSHFTRPQIQQVGPGSFRDLWNCHKEDGSGPLLGVSRTNGFNVPDLREPLKPGFPERAGNYSGTWKLISRLNHSCRANIGARWDSSSFSMHVYAGRDIKRGEELCLSYLGVTLQPTASRQCDLRSYGFECTCPACANDASSDARCKEIGVVTDSQWFLSGSSLKVTMKQQKDAIERAIALMEAEGLQLAGQYGNLLLRMSQVCGASQDQGRERKYKKMYETFCRVTLKK
ncbi:hypothetical protein VNI00_013407 [Paramarasmius palmivorus]|uniref:SET domain-containing protein n=1 Tax=Paramarasmius palmivorus TaxID=297713 RepID=A0AAW0BY77_9AGAR